MTVRFRINDLKLGKYDTFLGAPKFLTQHKRSAYSVSTDSMSTVCVQTKKDTKKQVNEIGTYVKYKMK